MLNLFQGLPRKVSPAKAGDTFKLKMSRLYCSSAGCFNNSTTNPSNLLASLAA